MKFQLDFEYINEMLLFEIFEVFEEKLKTANIEYQYALKDKWWTYTYMVVFGFLGALAFFCLFKFFVQLFFVQLLLF